MNDTLSAALQSALQAGVERGAAAGVTALVVDREGVRFEGGFGERQIGSGVDMSFNTVGAIFSMTKPITGTAAMMLVEQGSLRLDTPASAICPEIGSNGVLIGFDDDGQPITEPVATPVTLRHLLTHTSGYVYDIWNADMARWYEATGTPNVLSLQKAGLNTPLTFQPGTHWEYGIGIDWVGQMVEAVSGKTLGEFVSENITGPLGMVDTAFAHSPDMLARASAIHGRVEDGSLAPMDLPAPENPEFEMGGGGLHSTMSDYGRFMRMILNDGELDGVRLLKPETVHEMASNNMGDLRVKELKTVMPPFSADAEFFPGDPKTWGLTFQINEVAASTGRPAGTLMWAGLSNCFFWIDRTNGIAGAYMSQMLPFADQGTLDLFYEFETAVYNSL